MSKDSTLNKLAKRIPRLRDLLKERELLQARVKELEARSVSLSEENQELRQKLEAKLKVKTDIIWPLLKKEIEKVDFDHTAMVKPNKKHEPPLALNWVVPGTNLSSGGHQDIFRTISYLSGKGHDCQIYIYDVRQESNLTEQKQLLKSRYPNLRAEIAYNTSNFRDCDGIFATHWVTAYPVYNFAGRGRKYYYVQDFEPFFEPAGYLNYLSEKTYQFGFRGLTLGPWLSKKLARDYKMQCDYFDFGYDPMQYQRLPGEKTKDVLYYIRPHTARRGVELAIMALERFHARNPDSTIHLFGSDTTKLKIPFPFVSHGVLDTEKLNALYNKCAAGIVLSFSNMSLIPLEMIAAGCTPIVNDAEYTRMVKYSDWVEYTQPTPKAVASALERVVRSGPHKQLTNPDRFSWDHSNETIEKLLIQDLIR